MTPKRPSDIERMRGEFVAKALEAISVHRPDGPDIEAFDLILSDADQRMSIDVKDPPPRTVNIFGDSAQVVVELPDVDVQVDKIAATKQLTVGTGPSVRVSETAMKLTGWASRLLPATARTRYMDEFRSDLYEMAAAGLPRRKLVMYAVRLLPRMFALRRAVSTRRERVQ